MTDQTQKPSKSLVSNTDRDRMLHECRIEAVRQAGGNVELAREIYAFLTADLA